MWTNLNLNLNLNESELCLFTVYENEKEIWMKYNNAFLVHENKFQILYWNGTEICLFTVHENYSWQSFLANGYIKQGTVH